MVIGNYKCYRMRAGAHDKRYAPCNLVFPKWTDFRRIQ